MKIALNFLHASKLRRGYRNVCGGLSGAFIASGGEPSVGSNIMDLTYRIQAWNFVHAQPPDLNRGLLLDSQFLSRAFHSRPRIRASVDIA